MRFLTFQELMHFWTQRVDAWKQQRWAISRQSFMSSSKYFSLSGEVMCLVTVAVHFRICAFTLQWQMSVSNSDFDNVRCLIFVDRKITARVIERTIKKIGRLSYLSVSFLTGGSSVDALTPNMQKETLDLFRSGKVIIICQHFSKLKRSSHDIFNSPLL